MKRLIVLFVLAAVTLVGATSATGGDAPGGNGGQPRGGDNPCPPSQHGVYNEKGQFVGCEHNGNGGGNCGQNQSGKGPKGGNGGDHGYGHKDGCTEESTPPPPSPPPTNPPPTRPPTSPPAVTPPASTPPTSTPKAAATASTQPPPAKPQTVKTSSKVKPPTGDFKKDKCVKIKKGALYSCKIGNKRVIVVPGSG